MDNYKSLQYKHQNEFIKLSSRHKIIGFVRLLFALGFIYMAFQFSQNQLTGFLIGFFIFLFLFLRFLKIHQTISWNRTYHRILSEINSNEINFLKDGKSVFLSGDEFKIGNHNFANDLDIFGKNSLYEYLNRTYTYSGQKALADLLLSVKPSHQIIANQEAVKELSAKLEWRQKINALAILSKDSKMVYHKLVDWSKNNDFKLSKLIVWISIVSPILMIVFLGLYFFADSIFFGRISFLLFIGNLFVLATQLKSITRQINKTDEIHQIISAYSLIIQAIEDEVFESKELKLLQQKLINENTTASIQIKKLSKLFSSMDSINNPVGAILFNGFTLFHIHVFNKLLLWKKDNAIQVQEWLLVLGQIEALNSLANFSYNNSEFVFPELNNNQNFSFTSLGHPLIASNKRISNDISFQNQKLIVLSGSNMSGKSTFLRTVGINLLLSGIGAPVCASKATVCPIDIWVCMRLSDSLNDETSYFFAEVKRLKEIMNAVSSRPCFILLDEILRGTNSEDKRNGTIGVIKKINDLGAIGIVATHDLEVCELENEFPKNIANYCFESEVIANQLHFDYLLRKGICKNKNATFLMQQQGII